MLVHSKLFPTEADPLSLCFKKAYGRHAGVMQGVGVIDSSVILQLNKLESSICWTTQNYFFSVENVLNEKRKLTLVLHWSNVSLCPPVNSIR